MDPIQTELNNQLDAAIADVNALAAKSDATTEQIEAASAKMNGIKSRIEAVQSANAVKSWQSEPAQARDTTVATAVKTAGGSDAVATKSNVGVVEIDLFTGKVTQESGAGIIAPQQAKSMVDPAYTEGFKSWVRAEGQTQQMQGEKGAKSAFLEGRDSEGRLFVPPEIISGMLRRDPTPTRIADLVRTIPVGGDKAQLIKANYDADDLYSSAMRIYKVGEAGATKETDKPMFGLKTIDVHEWSAEISISRSLLQDTNFDIMGYFAEEFRTASRNMIAQKILLGNGVGEHFGIITRALQANYGVKIVKSGDANQLTWDSLRKIKNAVPEQYDMNCRYLFNKRSGLDTIEGFKDGNDRDLWPEAQRAGGIEGAPGRLRGYPYSLEAFMPDVLANALAVLFGDFTGYARVLRMGMSIDVLREIERRNNQVVFIVNFRDGGDLIEPWRLQALKIAA